MSESTSLLQDADPEVVEWLLREARANIAELADDLKGCYEPEKGWPPHIDKAAEMLAEIDDLLGRANEHRASRSSLEDVVDRVAEFGIMWPELEARRPRVRR